MPGTSWKAGAKTEKGAARPGRSNGVGRVREPAGKPAPRVELAKPTRGRSLARTPRGQLSPDRAVPVRSAPRGRGKVVVVDPLPLFRAGTVAALKGGGVPVVGEATNLARGVELVRAERASVLLLGGASVEQATEAVRAVPSCAVVVLMAQPSRSELLELLGTGIAGLALRSLSADDLVATVEAAAKGRAPARGAPAEPVFVPLFVGLGQPEEPPEGPNGAPGLTAKEREILTQLARGASNKEIAEALYVTPATVKTHLGHIYAKLGARSRHEALSRAFATGILR